MHIEPSQARPTDKQLADWRSFLETALVLVDVFDEELQDGCGLTLRWYDVLVHLAEADDGLRMNELAARILLSKSGLTRVVDQMEKAGLVRRERPPDNRRVVEVQFTPQGLAKLDAARAVHHASIERHFLQHIGSDELAGLAQALEGVREHLQELRPGRITEIGGPEQG